MESEAFFCTYLESLGRDVQLVLIEEVVAWPLGVHHTSKRPTSAAAAQLLMRRDDDSMLFKPPFRRSMGNIHHDTRSS